MAMILTTRGEMDETLLEKREGELDNEREHITWTEWWYQGEMVKRSAHVTLKEAAFSRGTTGG